MEETTHSVLTEEDILEFILENKDREASFELSVEFTKLFEPETGVTIGVMTGKEVKELDQLDWLKKLDQNHRNASQTFVDFIGKYVNKPTEYTETIREFSVKIGHGVILGLNADVENWDNSAYFSRDFPDDARVMVVL